MPINRNSTLLLIMLLALSAGCKKEEASAPPPPVKPAQPAPAAKPVNPVQRQISSAGKLGAALTFKKDPFKAFLVPQVAAPVAQGAGGARPSGPPAADMLPIQSYEVAKFKVSGIVVGLRENKALVVDPNGKGYVVQVGMQIGNANGRIARITPSTVEVVERSRQSGGRVKSRTIVLTLAKKR